MRLYIFLSFSFLLLKITTTVLHNTFILGTTREMQVPLICLFIGPTLSNICLFWFLGIMPESKRTRRGLVKPFSCGFKIYRNMCLWLVFLKSVRQGHPNLISLKEDYHVNGYFLLHLLVKSSNVFQYSACDQIWPILLLWLRTFSILLPKKFGGLRK